jgi:predicted metal-dependent hydrolase
MAENADTADSPHSREDALYLAGIEFFNRGEFFDAHEVWEDLWNDCDPADRRFYQALIQAAVAAYHWGRGNATGAKRLYHSGRKYMEPYRPAHRGLAVDAFWDAMAAHLAGALGDTNTASAPPPIISLERS